MKLAFINKIGERTYEVNHLGFLYAVRSLYIKGEISREQYERTCEKYKLMNENETRN